MSIFRLYIYANIHVALAVLSLLTITHLAFGLVFQPALYLFVFCNTVLTYNFIHYTASKTADKHNSTLILVFTIVLALVGGFSAMFLCPYTLLCAAFIGAFGFLYELPEGKFLVGFRQWRYLKSFVVAFCWASVTVLLPLVDQGYPLNYVVGLFWTQLFLWTLATLLPFEIRDLNYDNPKIKTIPQVLGVVGAKRLGYVMAIGIMVLEIFMGNAKEFTILPTALAVSGIVFFLRISTTNQKRYFASFWVEALPMGWMGATLLWRWVSL